MSNESDGSDVLTSMVARLNAFLYRCDAQPPFTMLYMSPSVQRVIGYPASDFIGNRVRSYASLVHADDAREVEGVFDKAMRERLPWQVEYRLSIQGGGHRWVTEQGSGIYDQEGRLQYQEGFVFSAEGRRALEVQERERARQLGEVSSRILTDTAGILGSLKTLSILAFNAKVEAARGGDAGRGFGVIATQISALAGETSVQADKINAHLQTVRTLLKQDR
jgi:PAS domain S-box-containing protein